MSVTGLCSSLSSCIFPVRITYVRDTNRLASFFELFVSVMTYLSFLNRVTVGVVVLKSVIL